jgi:hypothetical protein
MHDALHATLETVNVCSHTFNAGVETLNVCSHTLECVD